jgi:hypothetical protein
LCFLTIPRCCSPQGEQNLSVKIHIAVFRCRIQFLLEIGEIGTRFRVLPWIEVIWVRDKVQAVSAKVGDLGLFTPPGVDLLEESLLFLGEDRVGFFIGCKAAEGGPTSESLKI